MPCLCLANTRARWQSLKTSESSERKLGKIKPDLTVAERGIFSDGKIVRIPHQRTRITRSRSKLPTRLERPQSANHLKPLDSPERPVSGAAPAITRRSHVRLTRADLLNAESKLGSTIFGPIPEGHRREFFHDRNNIWIWHEDWYDGQRNPHQMTVRYEVRTSGIYKKVSTGKYFKLEGDELENFRKATHAYLYVIKKNLYNKTQNSPSPSTR